MKPREFILFSACSMALLGLGIDIMLPAFDDLRKHIGQDKDTSKIVSFFFMGQIVQFLFGILSDRFGRLFSLRTGFSLYIIGGFTAAFAPSFQVMLMARLVAGMGVSAVMMSTIAGVRDRFVGDRMAQTMSLVLTVFLLTPIFAPFIGALILQISSWQGVFLFPPLFTTIIFIWSFRMKESLSREDRVGLNLGELMATVQRIFKNTSFLRYTAITTLLFIPFSSYIASSEWIFVELYNRKEIFTWVFGGMGVFMAIATLTNSRLAIQLGSKKTIKYLIILYFIFGAGLLVSTLILGDPPVIWLFICLVTVLTALNVGIEPNSSALALEEMGSMAGIATSIYGTSFFFIGSLIGTFISEALKRTLLPLAARFLIIGLACLVLILTDRKFISQRT